MLRVRERVRDMAVERAVRTGDNSHNSYQPPSPTSLTSEYDVIMSHAGRAIRRPCY